MITTNDVLTEFVYDLGDNFILDCVNDSGVVFYYEPRRDIRFGLVTAPMFGVSKGDIGLVVTRNAYPKRDRVYKLEDPYFLDDIKSRVCYHLSNEGEDELPSDLAALNIGYECSRSASPIVRRERVPS